MGSRTTLALAFFAGAAGPCVGGCGGDAFACQSDGQCGGGQCVDGFCAFTDADCEGGLRYGSHAGALSGQCVGLTGSTGAVTSDSSEGPAESTEGFGTSPAGTTVSVVDSSSGDGAEATGSGSTAAEATGTTGEPVDADLVAWYRCDTTDSVTQDASGNANHGACRQCPDVATGVMGGACRFGNGEDIQVEHNASFELQAFTLAAWAWPNPIAEGLLYTVAAKPHGPLERNSYEIGFNFFGNTEVALMCYGGLDDGICSSTPVTTDQWIHVAMTYDGEFGRLYVNGELREEDPAPAVGISYDGAPLLIGIDLDNGLPAHPMDGLIDDVRFYSRALNAEELSAL